jgi:predicted ester cyclase
MTGASTEPGEASLADHMAQCAERIWDRGDIGLIYRHYAPNCVIRTPQETIRGREGYVQHALRQSVECPDRRIAAQPMVWRGDERDGIFRPCHICSIQAEGGGTLHAVRWTLGGRHLGYGSLGPPTGHQLSVTGITHFHVSDGKIVEEWAIYNELSMLIQLKIAALQAARQDHPTF